MSQCQNSVLFIAGPVEQPSLRRYVEDFKTALFHSGTPCAWAGDGIAAVTVSQVEDAAYYLGQRWPCLPVTAIFFGHEQRMSEQGGHHCLQFGLDEDEDSDDEDTIKAVWPHTATILRALCQCRGHALPIDVLLV